MASILPTECESLHASWKTIIEMADCRGCDIIEARPALDTLLFEDVDREDMLMILRTKGSREAALTKMLVLFT